MTRRIPVLQTPLPRRYFHATMVLIALNLLAFLVIELDPWWGNLLGLTPRAVIEGGAWWQPLTYMYVHAGVSDIVFNMIFFFFFGTAVEDELGSWEFLLFYHVTGILAGLVSLGLFCVTAQYGAFLYGASGAIFATALAFAAFRPRARVLFFFFIPLRARTLVLLYIAIDLASEWFAPYGGVAHLTHLTGFLIAFLYLLVRLRVNAWREFWA